MRTDLDEEVRAPSAAKSPSDQELREIALTRDEYELAVRLLGRLPGDVELGIIAALWSEHCGYKTSKPLLSRLPSSGAHVLQGPGENAGIVTLDGDLAVAFKIESHNHPSAIDPYQGAATGVGGILRDVFTMGARPVALLDSLRFGPMDEERQQHLLDGVVAGIGGYGNCMGVPTVGGELYFDDCYRHNCLVNAMCVGIVERSRITRAAATGAGNPVLLVGADTGRDGIHGATFASVELDEESESRRPAVQVGNPFLEKCLMEACLELAGDPRVVAIQDLGAAGLTSSAAEAAHRGGSGIEIDVACVPRRERGMTAYEVMLSESQERMLVVVRSGEEDSVREVFDRWDLHSEVIGRVTDSGRLQVRDGPKDVCDLPLDLLIESVPLRHPQSRRPPELGERLGQDPLARQPSGKPVDLLLALLGSPNLGSRRPVWRRYDHQVGDDTVICPGGDAAVVRVRGTRGALALTTDGNARYGALDPYTGAAIAVCEAARNIVATGARPLALTNCLNFGNPEKPEVFWELEQAIDGMRDACRFLEVPVVSGNVSLYNDSQGTSIEGTPVIGMVGWLDDLEHRCAPGFTAPGRVVGLVGPLLAELGGTEYQRIAQRANDGPRPHLDLDLEKRVQAFVHEAIVSGLLTSAHDCAEGGLAVALAEACLWGNTGAELELSGSGDETFAPGGAEASSAPSHAAGILFGESQSRFVISFDTEATLQLQALAQRHRVPFRQLGVTGGSRLRITSLLDVSIESMRRAYESALSCIAGVSAHD
ncbi:MAG TPA: phosphoribosylformylglycinamidine synthase subunit PurL [Candidatus Sulfotelmatobacter sp.]|nr:phosphoribosylformylglycinamidine synthase subunit PurL [Candidatus Sulfotelmatobacter sp.]